MKNTVTNKLDNEINRVNRKAIKITSTTRVKDLNKYIGLLLLSKKIVS